MYAQVHIQAVILFLSPPNLYCIFVLQKIQIYHKWKENGNGNGKEEGDTVERS